MNPLNMSIMQSPTAAAALKRELEASRLRRMNNGEDERKAKEAQKTAEELLRFLRGHKKNPRAAQLIAHLEPIVKAGAEALARYETFTTDRLVVAEEQYRAAKAAYDAAQAAHARGTIDAGEALEIAERLEVTGAALRYRDRALTDAQLAQRLPSVGLPSEFNKANESTLTLVDSVRKHGLDLSGGIFRPPVDVASYARRAGIMTDPPVAIWWIASELRSLEQHKEDAELAENLRAVFEHRWYHFQETQALPELARYRRREGL